MSRAVGRIWESHYLRSSLESPATIPVYLYGTAWKKDRTADLVYSAINAGFRGIDTAAQPRHYQEPLVGDGIRKAIADGLVRREDLYVQTKFSPLSAQDPDNMPYDANASLTEQIHASVTSSLLNLRPAVDTASVEESYIDTLVIHSPLRTLELTIDAWTALQTYVPSRIRHLGISNCSLPILSALCSSPKVTVKPAVVQNRFYDETSFDVPLRAYCRDHEIIYQSFWTLTANPDLARSDVVKHLARRIGITPAAALYTIVMGLGKTVVLNGTKNETRMIEDLEAPGKVEKFTHEEPAEWAEILRGFQSLVGDVV